MAGQQSYDSDFNIELARFQTTVNTTRLNQTIAFGALPDRSTSDPAFTLSASASSGLLVSFSGSTPAVCSVHGTTLSLSGQPGTCTVRADQAGDATYQPAQPVTRSFLVRDPARQDQTITFPPLPDRMVGETVTLSPTTTSGPPIGFSSHPTTVGSHTPRMGQHRLEVHRRIDRLDAHPFTTPHRFGVPRGGRQRADDGGPVRPRARLLDDDDGGAERGGGHRKRRAARSRAENAKVGFQRHCHGDSDFSGRGPQAPSLKPCRRPQQAPAARRPR